MTKFITKFAQDESGATAIEYGLLTALIAVVIIGAVSTLGSSVMTSLFLTASSRMSAAVEGAGS